MNIVYESRILLIRFAKVFPFMLCFLVAISFSETLFAILTESYANMDGYVILNKPISWFIARQYEYGIYSIIVALALSIAFETCIWNKISIAYLTFALWEKTFFDFELEPTMIYVICIANIIVAWYLIWKGFRILLK